MISKVDMISAQYSRFLGRKEQFYKRTWQEQRNITLPGTFGTLNRSNLAEKKGKKFSSFIDRLEWPEHEVRLFLKSRSHTLSIHSINDKILNRVECRVFFSEQ